MFQRRKDPPIVRSCHGAKMATVPVSMVMESGEGRSQDASPTLRSRYADSAGPAADSGVQRQIRTSTYIACNLPK